MTVTIILLHVSTLLMGAALIPQTIHTLKSGTTKGLCLTSYCIMALGLLSFTVYGFFSQNLVFVIANAIGLSLASFIIACKMRNKD